MSSFSSSMQLVLREIISSVIGINVFSSFQTWASVDDMLWVEMFEAAGKSVCAFEVEDEGEEETPFEFGSEYWISFEAEGKHVCTFEVEFEFKQEHE